MLKFVSKCAIKEGRKEEFIALASQLAVETRKETGCISYYLCQDVYNPNVLAFIEEWESKEAMIAHTKAKHVLEIVPKLNELQEKEVEIGVYFVVV